MRRSLKRSSICLLRGFLKTRPAKTAPRLAWAVLAIVAVEHTFRFSIPAVLARVPPRDCGQEGNALKIPVQVNRHTASDVEDRHGIETKVLLVCFLCGVPPGVPSDAIRAQPATAEHGDDLEQGHVEVPREPLDVVLLDFR